METLLFGGGEMCSVRANARGETVMREENPALITQHHSMESFAMVFCQTF